MAQIVEHNAHDKALVAWGWSPGADREPAPGTQEQFGAIVAAWVETGRRVPERGGAAMNITIRVNGKDRQLDVDPEMPLLWALRDVLGLTGTKYGCGEALCGACTVHLNGQVVRSCVTPVRRAASAEVVTIEGLSPDGTHPLQKAWVELGVPQCGFCQAGQLMTAAALLKKHARPTDEQIDQSMAGNLCRCGTYGRIREAIKKAAGVGQ